MLFVHAIIISVYASLHSAEKYADLSFQHYTIEYVFFFTFSFLLFGLLGLHNQMFSMNKYIGAHVEPYKPVDLESSSSTTIARKRKAKSSSSSREKGDDSKKKKKKATGTQTPYHLSEALQAVVGGKTILPRPQVTQALWVYIREHNLQNPLDKREIICDTKLRRVMGEQEKVTMFSMNKFITAHLLEKADKSEYVHTNEDEDGGGDESEDGVVDDESHPDDDEEIDDSNDDDDDDDDDSDDE